MDGIVEEIKRTDVDLHGLLAVVGEHLYSTPLVALRELVQNAHDSIVRRRIEDGSAAEGSINVSYDPNRRSVVVSDNGAGLTRQELITYLATIGAGYTRLLREDNEQGLIGMFGLGFLSAFVLADEVTVRTTSFREPDRGHAYVSSDGASYRLADIAPKSIGTEVTLHLKREHQGLLGATQLRTTLRHYCALLRVPVWIDSDDTPLNSLVPPWRISDDADEPTPHPAMRRRQKLEFASHFEQRFEPLCTLDVRPSGGSDVRGMLWVQSGSTYGTSDNRHLAVYVRGMLLGDNAHELLPEWAGFLSGVVESDDLEPTASREDLRRDGIYDKVQRSIQESAITGLADIASQQPEVWRTVLRRHNEALLGASICDERLFALLVDSLTVPTSQGDMTLPALLRAGGGKAYLSTGDADGSVAVLTRCLGIPVAKGHRYGVTPVVREFCRVRGLELVELGTDLGDAEIFVRVGLDAGLVEWFSEMLGCGEAEELLACRFEPSELPFVVVPNREAQLKQAIENDDADRRMAASALRLARLFTDAIEEAAPIRIYLNTSCPVVEALSEAHRSGHAASGHCSSKPPVGEGLHEHWCRRSGAVRLPGGIDRLGDLHHRSGGLTVDIWNWVYGTASRLRSEGQGVLAEQILGLADVATGGPAEQVDAVIPGLVAAARAIDSPWLEVFVRHWHLQNRVIRRGQGVAALGEAVSLYEFAHREETQDCPQSICVTQDLLMCYGTVDGPGYVQERVEAAEEALDRIDPTWGCFECLTAERCSPSSTTNVLKTHWSSSPLRYSSFRGTDEPSNAYSDGLSSRAPCPLRACGRGPGTDHAIQGRSGRHERRTSSYAPVDRSGSTPGSCGRRGRTRGVA